jgi:PKD repeat protein
MGSRGLAKVLSIGGMAPMLATVQGCEPPVCSMFGEQIQAEGCGESSKLNSPPEVTDVTSPGTMKPGRPENFTLKVRDVDGDEMSIEWDLDGDGDYDTDKPVNSFRDHWAIVEQPLRYGRRGDYKVRLRITDYPQLPGGPGPVVVERRIRVRTQAEWDANRKPAARLRVAEPVLAGTEFEVDASASTDPDGDQLEYQIGVEEPAQVRMGSDPSKRLVTFPADVTEDQHLIDVRVYDEYGEWDLTGKYVWSYDASRQPRARLRATPNHVRPGRAVTFDAHQSSIGGWGGDATFEWDLDGEQGYELNTGMVDHAMRSYDTPGHRTARLRITNHLGFRDFATVDVYVGDGPQVALAVDPPTPCAGLPVTFDASGSTDPDDDIVRYQWDLDGTSGFERDSSEPRAEHTYYVAGRYFINVRATDATGNDDTATLELEVEDCGDTAPTAALHADPFPGTVGDQVVFTATQATPGIVRYQWDLDGTQGYEQETTIPEAVHTYSHVGEYVLRLRVVDAAGRDHVAGLTLPVQPRLQSFGRVSAGLPRWFAPRTTVAATRRKPARPFSAELRDTKAQPIAGLLGGAGRARVRLGGSGGLTRAERSMRQFLRARWRTGLRFATRPGGRATVSGLVLAQPAAGGRRARACAKVALDLRAGRLPHGKLTILGGTGDAARLRGTASFRFRADPAGPVAIVGELRAKLGTPRPLRRACRALS